MRTLAAETPISNPAEFPLVAWGRRVEDALYTLHLFGSAGIAAFGWAMCRLLRVAATPWVILWFAAGLFIYNVDRLRADPADELNIPQRVRSADGLRPWSILLLIASAAALLLVPLARRDWTTLGFVLLGTPFCLNYSIPLRGRRSKDIPYLKTFFAPTLVLVAVFVLPLTHLERPVDARFVASLALWGWGVLMGNMILCDLRDLDGDLQTGVGSIPTLLGRAKTRQLLWLLAAGTCLVGLAMACFFRDLARRGAVLAVATSLYIGFLTLAVNRPRGERFYERWVEGILFVPAILVAAIPS